jgi:drug/metabolite transporter (DMT)-like permease
MNPIIMTVLALIAFAANSVLCRLALAEYNIDAASFTAIRLSSGAITLFIILLIRNQGKVSVSMNYWSALMLFVYALFFSYSYIEIATGTGALILFGSVQLTMILYSICCGERPGNLALLGLVIAFAGLVYLLMPGVTAPSLFSALLMMIAGIAWGVYTLRGKDSTTPLTDTTWNFIATIPLLVITSLILIDDMQINKEGVILAIASGALASGMGYAIWYAALAHLSSTNAATVQLSVPVIATIGGVLFMAEPITVRMMIAGIVVLGGIYLTIHFGGKSALK